MGKQKKVNELLRGGSKVGKSLTVFQGFIHPNSSSAVLLIGGFDLTVRTYEDFERRRTPPPPRSIRTLELLPLFCYEIFSSPRVQGHSCNTLKVFGTTAPNTGP